MAKATCGRPQQTADDDGRERATTRTTRHSTWRMRREAGTEGENDGEEGGISGVQDTGWGGEEKGRQTNRQRPRATPPAAADVHRHRWRQQSPSEKTAPDRARRLIRPWPRDCWPGAWQPPGVGCAMGRGRKSTPVAQFSGPWQRPRRDAREPPSQCPEASCGPLTACAACPMSYRRAGGRLGDVEHDS